jgi:long-chain acyl-CoA synthetase
MKKNVNIVNPDFDMTICDIKDNKKLDYNQTGIIKVKCEQTMKGYYKNEEKTKEVFDSNGYFITGDLGYLTENNYLYFEGRQKNIIALNNGEKINPVKIEEICKQSPFVEQIVVAGQEKPYLTALIVPNKDFIKKWATKKNIDISVNNGKETLKRDVLIDINNLIGKNKFFKWIEQVKNISFIDEKLTVNNGFLTAKYTIIRNKVYEKYKTVIENMYK